MRGGLLREKIPLFPLKSVFTTIVYLLGTVLLGALLAPWLYHLLQNLEPTILANQWARIEPYRDEVVVRGPLAALVNPPFQKVFNRAVLLAAVLLLWPAVRALRIRGLADLRLRKDLRAGPHFWYGFGVAGGVVALMGAGYLFLHFYHLKVPIPWGALPRLALTAAVVAVLEEALFRGAILGLFLRSLRPAAAVFWTTLVFAVIHYLKPDDEVVVGPVTWSSGFTLLPHVFHQFGEPMMLAANLTTLLVLGWLLALARLRTGALWMSIGMHAGVVLVKMSFSKITKRDEVLLPWVGPELQIGLVPVLLLLLALYVIWRRLEYEELLPNPRPRA